MANLKITQLPAAVALLGGELLVGVQSGSNVKITTAQLFAYMKKLGGVEYAPPYDLTDAATVTIDPANGNYQRLALTNAVGSTRLLANPINLLPGMIINIDLIQPPAGGLGVTFGTLFKWPGDAVPTLSPSGNKVDTMSIKYDGTRLQCTMIRGYS